MESLADTGLATMKRFKLLQEVELKSVEDQSRESLKKLFLAQFDRFELWAVNLGVFVMGHGSLDYRIRDSESMKEAILQMMKNLNRSLDEALAYIHGDTEQEDEDEDTDSCSEMESDMDLLLDSIKDPIDRLYKMAVWIRNPATRITSTKARNLQQVDEETNVDLFKSFEKFDYEHISSLFLEYEKNKAIQENPIAKPHDTVGDDKALVGDQVWEPIRKTLELNRMKLSNGDESYLVRRIARANGIRRQQFAYWRKHRSKLREHATFAVEVPTHNLPTTSHIIQLEDKNEKIKAPLTVTTATQLRVSHETGKELGKENVMTLAVSEYAPSAWNPSKDIVNFPPAPKISTGNEFFECPYCYTICPASILSEKAWRAHLIRDSRPYICTFEQCLSSEQLYDSRDDWIQHETSTHQTVFRCPLHEEETFTTLATYEEHTQKYHNEDAMPSSFTTSTATNVHRSCPICSVVLGTTQKLQSHIALHLERFAMFSLPRCIDDNNEGSSGGRSSSALFDSNRSFNEGPDIESNAAGKEEDIDTIIHEAIGKIKALRRYVAALHSSNHMASEKDDEYFVEMMAQSRSQLSRYGEVIRAWTPDDIVNKLLFEFGEACMEAGSVEEAIETLEHLKLIQSGQPEHDEPALLRTKQLLATAYQVKEALQEVEELSRDDPNLYDKPINTKILHIFARTEAGKRHAETIWGPSIWNIRQSQKELEHGDDPDSFLQRPIPSRPFDSNPLPMPSNKKEEFPPLTQNEDVRREEVYAQAQSQAPRQAKGPQQAHGNATLRDQLFNRSRLVFNRLIEEATRQFSGSENIPQDTVDRIIQQSYMQAKQSVRDLIQQEAVEQPYILSGRTYLTADIPKSHSGRFNELMEQLFKETDVDKNHILSETIHFRRHLDASAGCEVVYCHACAGEWYRDEPGLLCPRCGSDLTEIVNPDNDPRDLNNDDDSESESPPEIPRAQVSFSPPPLDGFPKSNRPKIRPVSGDAVFIASLGGGSHPEIAQAASHQVLPGADEGSFKFSDGEDNASQKSPSQNTKLPEADIIQQPDGAATALRAVTADTLAAGSHLFRKNKPSFNLLVSTDQLSIYDDVVSSPKREVKSPPLGGPLSMLSPLSALRRRFPLQDYDSDHDSDQAKPISKNILEDRNDHLDRDVIGNSRSESTGAEGEPKSDLSDEEVQDQIPDGEESQHQQPQDNPYMIRDDFGNRDEGSDVQEGVDHADHSGQDSSQADHDRRVPMDPPDIGEFASERYFEKLRQLQTDHQQTNDDESNATTTATASEFILPLRDSSSPTDEKPKPSARGKKSFLSLRQKAAAHATHRLSSVDIIAEQEEAGSPYLFWKEDNEMRGGGHDNESEIMVLKEMFRVLVEESQAEFEQAAEGTELKLEAQRLARTLAQQTTLYMLDVQELKIQYFGATNILERNEKGHAFVNKIRSFDFLGKRDMIKEIQKKREAEEERRAETARERNEKQAQSEERLILKIEEAGKELTEHEERKLRIIERHVKAFEAKRGQKDSSAALPELEARDASTEIPTRIETSKSELSVYEDELAAEDKKIRIAVEKLIGLKEVLRRVRAEKDVQVPSGSESQKSQSRRSETTWQCCQCGTGDLEFHVDYYCTKRDCRHPFCHNCFINFDYVGSA